MENKIRRVLEMNVRRAMFPAMTSFSWPGSSDGTQFLLVGKYLLVFFIPIVLGTRYALVAERNEALHPWEALQAMSIWFTYLILQGEERW